MNTVFNSFNYVNTPDDIDYNFDGYGQLGYFITNKCDDKIFHLPSPNSNNMSIGHKEITNFVLRRCFSDEYKEYFNKVCDKIRENTPDNVCFVDSPELVNSFFIASVGNILFINSSNKYFFSGLLFVPEDLKSLSEFQRNSLYSILDKFPKENDSVEVIKIPSIDNILKNGCELNELSVDSYKDMLDEERLDHCEKKFK